MEDLSKVIKVINLIQDELVSLVKLSGNLELSKTLYDNVLINISNNLLNFKILDNKLLEYNSLYKSHIDIINYKLEIINLEINEIKSLYETSKEGYCKFLCISKGVKFTDLNIKINNSFKGILPILKDVNNLQHIVLGETIRIENKLFKYGWLLSGKNDINKSKIDENIFKNNLFYKYKEELKEALKNRDMPFNSESKTIEGYIQSNISIITDCIDSIFNIDDLDERDHKISINELNRTNEKYLLDNCSDLEDIAMVIYTRDEEQDKYKDIKLYNIKANYVNYMNEDLIRIREENEILLKTKRKLEIDNNSIDSDNEDEDDLIIKNYYNFKEVLIDTITLEYNNSDKVVSNDKRPTATGYGSDFPCCIIKKFNINKHKTTSDKIIFIINAEDQNWGGTGHINVRYTLNNNNSEIGFFINREKVQEELINSGIEGINQIDNNNNYLIEFSKQDLQNDENILTFYLFCPKWNGSIGYIKNIKVNKEVKIHGVN